MELTRAQIERQDFVDNKIQALLNELSYPGHSPQWDMANISSVRDAIQDFYPFISGCEDE